MMESNNQIDLKFWLKTNILSLHSKRHLFINYLSFIYSLIYLFINLRKS